MTASFKSRVGLGEGWKATYQSFSGPIQTWEGHLPRSVQRIMTEGHYGYQTANGQANVGGPFENWKVTFPILGHELTSRYNYQPGPPPAGAPIGWQYDVTTRVLPSAEVANHVLAATALQGGSDSAISAYLSPRVPNGPTPLELNAKGARAIDMVKPTNPTFDLATTLGELWAERKFFAMPGSAGSLSGEYLNYMFGIAPTIGAVQDLRKAIEGHDVILRQYQRDSERVIRRSYRFPQEVDVTTSGSNTPAYGLGSGLNYFLNPGGRLTKTTTRRTDFKFSGAFKYAIPKDAFPKTLSELDRIYGVRPGLSTAWELMPYSWLVDYFSPIGSILDNLDAFLLDGLVMPYAYITCTQEVDEMYTWRGPLRSPKGDLQTVDVVALIQKKRQRRVPANPFGFGLLMTDLTPTQLSILAALGMSRR